MFDPEGQVLLIDHETAAGSGINPGDAVNNWLANRLRDSLEHDERDSLLAALRAQAVKAHRIKLSGSPADLQLLNGGQLVYIAVLQFIAERLDHLDRLLSERILPEQKYLVDHPDSPASDHDTARASDV